MKNMVREKIKCPYCGNDRIGKHGKNKQGNNGTGAVILNVPEVRFYVTIHTMDGSRRYKNKL